MAANSIQIQAAAELELRRRRARRYTVVGLVCPKSGHTHSLSNKSGSWLLTQEDPQVYIAAKLEKVLKSNKRYIGRPRGPSG